MIRLKFTNKERVNSTLNCWFKKLTCSAASFLDLCLPLCPVCMYLSYDIWKSINIFDTILASSPTLSSSETHLFVVVVLVLVRHGVVDDLLWVLENVCENR